jgi:uncharacterized ubiquitin-like protein YukD
VEPCSIDRSIDLQTTTVKDLKLDKDKMLQKYTLEGLELALRTQTSTKKFIDVALESRETAIASSEKELINKVANSIQGFLFAKALLRRKEIITMLNKMLKEEFRIVSRMIFMIERKTPDTSLSSSS